MEPQRNADTQVDLPSSYESPAVEHVVTVDELDREVLYAGTFTRPDLFN
jgi:hypothetical protein